MKSLYPSDDFVNKTKFVINFVDYYFRIKIIQTRFFCNTDLNTQKMGKSKKSNAKKRSFQDFIMVEDVIIEENVISIFYGNK